VPFYFANRAPMLYSIHTGCVQGYAGGQVSVVYLCSSAEGVARMIDDWCFTDGHAVEAITSFYDSLSQLGKLDWKVIESWSWGNRDDDLDRKRRKQAEFLVPRFFPWQAVDRVGVIDRTMKTRVEGVIAGAEHRPPVSVRRKWYYD